jgi:hypothetical protein
VTERDVDPAVAGRVTAFGRPRVVLQSFDRSHVRVLHVRFECSGAGSSAPEHLRVRQQVTDDTVHWGRTHLSRIYHIPFRAGAGYSVVTCVYIYFRISEFICRISGTVSETIRRKGARWSLSLWLCLSFGLPTDPTPSRRVSCLSESTDNHPAGTRQRGPAICSKPCRRRSGVAYAVHTVRPAARALHVRVHSNSPIRCANSMFRCPMWRAVPRSYILHQTRLGHDVV